MMEHTPERAGPGGDSPGMVPFRFDLSDLVRRSVATLYSHLVTRPTGQALRLGIESQIGEMGELCLSVLDFTEVVVLDYSCADEAVAKLLQRYQRPDRPANAYFLARGVGEHHRETLDEVLVRHRLALVAEVAGEGLTLLGVAEPLERRTWSAVQAAGVARPDDLPRALGAEAGEVEVALETLARQRVVVPGLSPGTFHALSTFLVAD
ncbi:MAG TPA: hypothetical protein VMK65_10400 [Longimicrobiales bacterium]|nr:hypothetical protein [Longimicrobiales bacterium]